MADASPDKKPGMLSGLNMPKSKQIESRFSNYRIVSFYTCLVSAACTIGVLGIGYADTCMGGPKSSKTDAQWGAAVAFGVCIQALFALYLKRRRLAEVLGYNQVGVFNGKYPNKGYFIQDNLLRAAQFLLLIFAGVAMIVYLVQQKVPIDCESATVNTMVIVSFVLYGVLLLSEIAACAFEDPEKDKPGLEVDTGSDAAPLTWIGHALITAILAVNVALTLVRISHAHSDSVVLCSQEYHMQLALLLFLAIISCVSMVSNYIPHQDLTRVRPWKFNIVPYLCAILMAIMLFTTFLKYEADGQTLCAAPGGEKVDTEKDAFLAQFILLCLSVGAVPLYRLFESAALRGDNAPKHRDGASAYDKGEKIRYSQTALREPSGMNTNRLTEGTLQFV